DAGEGAVDAFLRGPLARGGEDPEVLATGQVVVEARFLDDRADAGEGRLALGRHQMTEERDRPGRRGGQTEQHPDQGRLAGAVRSEVAEGDTARDAQIDVVDDGLAVEVLGQAGRLDDVRR